MELVLMLMTRKGMNNGRSVGVIDNQLSPRSSSSVSDQAHRDPERATIKISCHKDINVDFENRRSTDTMRFVKPRGKLVHDG